MRIYGATDKGKARSRNEDAFAAKMLADDLCLLCVCDGMGGEAGGKEASSLAIEAFCDAVADFCRNNYDKESGTFPYKTTGDITAALSHGVSAANKDVRSAAREDPSLGGMGSTLAAALIAGKDIYGVYIGDSRIYLLQNGALTRLSHDHSFVQHLVDIGEISQEEAKHDKRRNLITKAVGAGALTAPDTFTLRVEDENAKILLCSDGLSSLVSDEEILMDISNENLSVTNAVHSLIRRANERGGSDNITVVLGLL